jgi:non-heme chloroperoxidase
MSTITVKDGTTIYYKDWGKGQPMVFSHGWPLSADDWEVQMLFFGQHGYRVIAHDRRGHGRSTQTWDGNEMDTYADDLAALTEKLDLKNQSTWATQPVAEKSPVTSAGMARNVSPWPCSSARFHP